MQPAKLSQETHLQMLATAAPALMIPLEALLPLSPAQPAPQQIPGCRRKHSLLLIPQKHLLAFSDLASKQKGFALQLHGQRMGRAGLEGRLQTPTEPELSPAPGTAQLSRALLRGSRGYFTPNSQKREQKHLAEDLD